MEVQYHFQELQHIKSVSIIISCGRIKILDLVVSLSEGMPRIFAGGQEPKMMDLHESHTSSRSLSWQSPDGSTNWAF